MRKIICFAVLISLFSCAALFAQTGTLPQMVNRMFNPALYQQRVEAIAPVLGTLGEREVIGLNGALVNYGAGGNLHYQWPLKKDLAATLDLAMIYLDLGNPFLPFYSRTYRSADVMLVPFFFGLRRDVLRETFDNSFLPYLQVGAGPLAGFAFPYGYSFWESLRHATTAWTIGGFAGAGVNFAIDKKTAGLLDLRYNVMIFPERIGPRHDYSGPAISVGVLRGF
ncbi:MAG: hypothetical protein ONB44_01585 [candidate division KSB1 bacterium]|nr:hypothetical protein [candidate division KSB1 bacterium]MDZ7300812.1 hypothetical protein [candidate division KSB1 bacterium]MDZ7309917.1 hypothetical protein [candidate division KSB1 bacterium]